uniref:Uncharacterized protein n=1 Tax=Anguilla anguilla TaxID=7936 RepID=A0A0E9W7U6_ANGAN
MDPATSLVLYPQFCPLSPNTVHPVSVHPARPTLLLYL